MTTPKDTQRLRPVDGQLHAPDYQGNVHTYEAYRAALLEQRKIDDRRAIVEIVIFFVCIVGCIGAALLLVRAIR